MRQRWCIALRLPVQLRANNQIIVGDFMIDDTNYADCLALYNFDHVEKHSI